MQQVHLNDDDMQELRNFMQTLSLILIRMQSV